METAELFEIARLLDRPVRFLVFGLGNDSIMWHRLNKKGRTVFIEDQRHWFKKITKRNPYLEAYLVDYDTKLEQWDELLNSPEKLSLELPEQVCDVEWDVILVDAPAGYADGTPGRMKSIYTASRLIKDGGSVFVHDANRPVERLYSNTYLLKKNLVSEVRGRSLLHHYVVRR